MDTANKEAPKVTASETVFRGRVVEVVVDTISEGGLTYPREVVHHPGSAVIVPIFDDGSVAFVRQYRHPAVRYLLEVPAGTLHRGEVPEAGAARELEEELGLVCASLEKLCEFFVSPGFLEEKMWVFLATGLSETQQKLDEDELIEIVRMPLTQALSMITTGEIEDAKTIIGLMLAAPRVGPSMLEAAYPAV
jgi:ADP-ribose pyrophosphatase